MRQVFLLAVSLAALAGQTMEGALEPKLLKRPNPRWRIDQMPPATPAQRVLLPVQARAADLVWYKETLWKGLPGKCAVAIVDRPGGEKWLIVDANGNGEPEKSEVREFQEDSGRTGSWDVRWDFPPASGPFRTLPVDFRILAGNSKLDQPQLLHINDWFEVAGVATISGRASGSSSTTIPPRARSIRATAAAVWTSTATAGSTSIPLPRSRPSHVTRPSCFAWSITISQPSASSRRDCGLRCASTLPPSIPASS